MCFVLVLLLLFASCLRLPSPATFSFPPFPSLPPSTGWVGVHMIKPASQVITWRCQIKRPLIQMRSEISKSVVASAATAHPRRRSEGSGSCREAATTLLPFLHKYQQCRQQSPTCPGSPERVYLYHTARLSVISCWYPWWRLQCGFNTRGSSLLSDLADVLPAARLSKGQRSETHESKCALKLWRVQRSPGASLLFFHLDFMLLKKKKKKWNAR